MKYQGKNELALNLQADTSGQFLAQVRAELESARICARRAVAAGLPVGEYALNANVVEQADLCLRIAEEFWQSVHNG